MMKIDLATLFPEMCETVLGTSIVGRARRAGYLDIRCWQIRDYTVDKHNNVDPLWPRQGDADAGRPHVPHLGGGM